MHICRMFFNHGKGRVRHQNKSRTFWKVNVQKKLMNVKVKVFNHREGNGIQQKAILEQSRRCSFKNFSNHGEGNAIQKKKNLSILAGVLSKLSSTMVKVEACK